MQLRLFHYHLRRAISACRSASCRAFSVATSCTLRTPVSSSLLTSSASRVFSDSMYRNAEPWKMEMQHLAVSARDRYAKKKTRPKPSPRSKRQRSNA